MGSRDDEYDYLFKGFFFSLDLFQDEFGLVKKKNKRFQNFDLADLI